MSTILFLTIPAIVLIVSLVALIIGLLRDDLTEYQTTVLGVNNDDHPQRRDVGGPRVFRWLHLLGIWLLLIPCIAAAIPVSVCEFAIGVESMWIVNLISIVVGLLVSAAVFFWEVPQEDGSVKSVSDNFFVDVPPDFIYGLKKNIGARVYDEDGYQYLGFFPSGIHPKLFYESLAFRFDISRELIITQNDVSGVTPDKPLLLETRGGKQVKVYFRFAVRADLRNLQALAKIGSSNVDEPDLEDESTDQFKTLRQLLAGEAVQVLTTKMSEFDIDEVMGPRREELLHRWSGVDSNGNPVPGGFAGQANRIEQRYGVHLGSFAIDNIDYTDTMEKTMDAERAVEILLRKSGFTGDPALWGQPIQGNARGDVWEKADDETVQRARQWVRADAGQATHTIDDKRITITDIESLASAFAAFMMRGGNNNQNNS